ncbi:MAG: hypothetical protein KDB03_23035 [Planctomycetales bacterium]|nr:hypothetical protein [Planctomycetales bacterium]
MRKFNKVFVIALPRCATVSMCDALGMLGIRTAHLGRIYGEQSVEHNHPERLMRMHEQIQADDFGLDILRSCDGLADYPACASSVFVRLDKQYPGSLFINVRRDSDPSKWLQSVERQFRGLELLKLGKQSTSEEKAFMRTMQSFRCMTFGQVEFSAEVFQAAYYRYQDFVADYFAGRPQDLLQIPDVSVLDDEGFGPLCKFLECDIAHGEFPCRNDHSQRPHQAFMSALSAGKIKSLTGIQPEPRPTSVELS